MGTFFDKRKDIRDFVIPARLLIFSLLFWLSLVVPASISLTISSGWASTIPIIPIAALINVMVVTTLLLIWNLIQKRIKVPPARYVLVGIFLLIFSLILVSGLISQNKDPEIREGIHYLFNFLIFPPGMLLNIAPEKYSMIILNIFLGSGFYYFVGKSFERFVINKKPNGLNKKY